MVTERLVVRCWEPADAPLLKEAVDSSLEHLRPWMPWAHEDPQPLEQKVELIRGFRGRFDLGQDAVVFALLRGDFPGTPSESAPLEAFDAAARRVL